MALSVDLQLGLAVMAALGLASAGIGLTRIARFAWRRTTAPRRSVARGALADEPVPFGWSTAWLAVRSRDTLGVIQALKLSAVEQTGWQAGIATIHDDAKAGAHVFVTPPVDGWTFVVGYGLPHPSADPGDRCTLLLQTLAQHFPDVQYFFSDPTIDLYGWSRYQAGKPLRRFAASGSELLVNQGPPLSIEQVLGLPTQPATRARLRIVDQAFAAASEEIVLKVAAIWSLDPTSLPTAGSVKALGFLGRVPATWRQRHVSSVKRAG